MRGPRNPLPGRVVAITGAGRGIGAATARALHRAGAVVVLGDLDVDLVTAAAEDLNRAAGPARAFAGALDVTDRASFTAFLDLAEQRGGRLDVLINNAGIMPLSDLADEPDEVTRRIVDVNLHGVLLGTKLAAARMSAQSPSAVPAHIVNLASVVGRIALPGAATYSASKFAVVGLSEAMRAELRDVPVAVSCVLPVVVNTELASGLGTVRGQRAIEPEEVAAAILATLERPRFEVWVPASAKRIFRVVSLFPRSAGEALGRLMGTTDILRKTDAAARAGYLRRTLGRASDPSAGLAPEQTISASGR
jgi:NAD(P)-dependent dehydrogenase (short-subunit alcohol dehydrogenase family)